MIDILIIGGGPAGLTAALYAARAGKSVTFCESESLGGQITQSPQVDNYPGLPAVSGMALADALTAQAMDAGAVLEFAHVDAVKKNEDGTFTAVTEDGTLQARAVIFAGGAKARPLGVAREEELVGRGVSYCALCDGAFFRGQDVAVVGGGSTAFSDALYLAKICRSVKLIHRRAGFRAELPLIEAAKATENLEILTPYTVSALEGEDALQALVLTDAQTGETKTVSVSAVFAAIGHMPNCAPIAGLAALDDGGYAVADEHCRTATPGLFVAGDCRTKEIRQLTTATADGTAAAVAACEYLG